MLRANFEWELQRLQDGTLALGSEVESNIVDVVDILRRRDTIGAQRLIAADQDINRKRIDIMNDALVLIATQQPMAGDMRMIASILEISGELERINDYVKGIARISLMIGPEPMPDAMAVMPVMAEKTRYMLHRALDATSLHDAELARLVPLEDDEVDELFNHVYRELVTYVRNDKKSIEKASRLQWAAHNLERAADRVTNICEWVVYMTTGKYVEMDSELEAPPAPAQS
jgi:phosphate transport system protein